MLWPNRCPAAQRSGCQCCSSEPSIARVLPAASTPLDCWRAQQCPQATACAVYVPCQSVIKYLVWSTAGSKAAAVGMNSPGTAELRARPDEACVMKADRAH